MVLSAEWLNLLYGGEQPESFVFCKRQLFFGERNKKNIFN